MNVLLVSPKTPTTFWSFKHALKFVSKRSAFPPLGLLTVAGMLPESWNLKLVDLNVSRLRDRHLRWADYVMIGAMIVQKESVGEVIRRCHALGRPVIAGGPLFTTGHESFGDDLHYVLGEAEEVVDELVADMETGQLQKQYEAAHRPDIAKAAVPRWDLIKPRHYVTMSVQFSRGCPYNCEFCDIIVMNGRVPRTKAPAQMLAELDAIDRLGWRGPVFIVDDNFIGNKRRVKAFLRELIAWRRRTRSHITLFTEASVNLADDPELMELMVEAGFTRVFLGLETPVLSSLEECQKFQNSRCDLADSVQVIQHAGLEVMGGFIVGFDNDPEDVFELQFEFIQKTGIVTAMVGLLTALPKTQLYQRLVTEGRLREDSSGNNTDTTLNFEPILDREFLINGYRRLMRSLYEPNSYYQRILTFLAEYRPSGHKTRISWNDAKAFVRSLWWIGVWHKGRRAYWKFLATTLLHHRQQLSLAITLAVNGYHFRIIAEAL